MQELRSWVPCNIDEIEKHTAQYLKRIEREDEERMLASMESAYKKLGVRRADDETVKKT